MEYEKWLPITGYEGLYEVSNTGKIKSLGRYKSFGNRGSKVWMDEKILIPRKDKYGYCIVQLCKNGKKKFAKVHRLVATAFVDNPKSKPFVDHINTIKNDNRVENLRWVTSKENSNNPITLKRNRKLKHNKRKVICLETQKIYNSIKEAGEIIGISESSIVCCCQGRNLTAKGLHWKYYE